MEFSIALQVGNGNPGDSIASYSGRALYGRARPDGVCDTWPLFEDRPFDYTDFRFAPYDNALLLCTPWIWDQAHGSLKYRLLADFLRRTDARRRVALGIGAAFLLHHDNPEERFAGELTAKGARPFWETIDVMICRDRLALEIFSDVLPPDRVHLMPCPSFYSAQLFGISHEPEEERLLVFSHVSPESHNGIRVEDIAAAMAYQDALIARGIRTMAMTAIDRRIFLERYGRRVDFDLRDPSQIIATIARFSSLVSPRVHACMPALSLGLDVEIVPLDSRALTAIHLGARPVGVPLQKVERYGEPIAPLSLDQAIARVRTLVPELGRRAVATRPPAL